MKENICTIPVNDFFNIKDGCPICQMHDYLEQTYVDYIVGDAMMEPTVRIETNKKGFCGDHFNKMVQTGNRLPNALILESHLQQIIDDIMPEKISSKPDKKQIQAIDSLEETCFVCDKIQNDIYHFFRTVFVEWQKNEEFKKLYENQEYICLKHYSMIMKAAMNRGIPSKYMSEFHRTTYSLAQRYLQTLKADVTHFCSMFDYRNRGGDWKNSRDAIERSILFLTGEKIERKE